MKAFRDAGLPEEGMLQVARTIGMATARIAEANRELSLRTLMQPGDTERDLALRFAAAAEYMQPLVEPILVYALRAHMLEQIRRDVIGAADLASGEMGATVEIAVCFADLVGSPSSARRSRSRSWAWSPGGSRRWRPRSPSRRCGW